MSLQPLIWSVGYTADPEKTPAEFYPATVPGAVQQDYANAKNWGPVQFETNYKDYAWMENMYWLYRAPLEFSLEPDQSAQLVFRGIDYRYQIRIDGLVLVEGEGMFTPVECDVTAYAEQAHTVEVLLYPVPKDPTGRPGTRDEARRSCKPAACYGWDWHPRLVSSGIWDEAGLRIYSRRRIRTMEVSYVLSEGLDHCRVDVQAELTQPGAVEAVLLFEGEEVARASDVFGSVSGRLSLELDRPRLWYPVGYGAQPVYTLRLSLLDETGSVVDSCTRRLGLRRSRLVMNEGSWKQPSRFPKSRSDAPATLEINGQRVFAKGSNWVNIHLYPGAVTANDYAALLKLVKDGNMNILRIWGGGFVNHEVFFDLCDDMGIMVWQEFPLACNEYPDDDHYLSVLEQEGVSIVRRLRTHPCVVLWCGGNELFNNWSRMTEQHHALRLLDKICYTEDRFTPFLMTSPLNGMAHGPYVNYDNRLGEENITLFVRSRDTAYTEFGSSGAADPDYIRQYCTQQDYEQCGPDNECWVGHFAFRAGHYPDTWLRTSEVEYFFGGYSSTEDLCHKSQLLHAMCCRSFFEEMRKQWPHCSMALNWCFNEPWPCFANNSLVCWPDIPKPAYYAVQSALRPKLASLRIDRHLWQGGERFNAELWMLNDSMEPLPEGAVEVSYRVDGGEPVAWGSVRIPAAPAQTNVPCGAIGFPLPEERFCTFTVQLRVVGHPEMDSEYTYLCRPKKAVGTAGMLNI